jgi:hypothetical protein
MNRLIILLSCMLILATSTVSYALDPDDKESGISYESLTFSAFNVELYPSNVMGRYYVNYSRWVGSLRGIINLTFGDKVVGAVLFLDDRTPLPQPEDQPKRGGYVIYYHWREFWEIYYMLTTYKSMGTYGSIFKKTSDEGTILFGLDFSQIAVEKNRKPSR